MNENYSFPGVLIRYEDSTTVKDATKTAAEAAEAAATPRASSPSDELHINLWEVGKTTKLDVGIMIDGWDDIEAVVIDLPWPIRTDQVIDLVEKLAGPQQIAAIFNEAVDYRASNDEYAEVLVLENDGTIAEINPAEVRNKFAMVKMRAEYLSLTILKFDECSDGTRLRVKLPKTIATAYKKKYIRFRILDVPGKLYSTEFRQKDRRLLSSSTETRIIDFRINARRGVPNKLFGSQEKLRFPNLSKIHFFLTLHRSELCEFEAKNFIGCRSLLDEDVWNDYLKRKSTETTKEKDRVCHFLGYQWTALPKAADVPYLRRMISGSSSGRVKDLTVLGRFSKSDSGPLYILRFIALAMIFGMMGNGTWEMLQQIEIEVLSDYPILTKAALLILCALASLVVLVPKTWLITLWSELNYKRRLWKAR